MEFTIGSLGYTFEALAIGPPVVGTASEVSDAIISQYKDWLGGPPVSWQIDEDKEALILTLHKISSELKKNNGYVEKALARLLYYNQSISSQSSVSDSDVLKMMLVSLISNAALQNVKDIPMSRLPDDPNTLPTDTVYIVGVTIKNAAHAVVMAYRKVKDNKGQEATGWIIFDPNGTDSPFALTLLKYFRKDKILSKVANIDNIHHKALSSNIFENGMGLARGMGWCQLFAVFTVMFLLQGRSVKTIEEFYGGKAFDYNEGSGQSNSDSDSDEDEEGQSDSSLLSNVDPESFLMVALRQACLLFYRNLCAGIKDNSGVAQTWKDIFVLNPQTKVENMTTLKLYDFDRVRLVPPNEKDAPIQFLLGYQRFDRQKVLTPERGYPGAYVKVSFENRNNSQHNRYTAGIYLTHDKLRNARTLSRCVAKELLKREVLDYRLAASDMTFHALVLYGEQEYSEEEYKAFKRVICDGIEDIVIDCSPGLIRQIAKRLPKVKYTMSVNVITKRNEDVRDYKIEDLEEEYETIFGNHANLEHYGLNDADRNELLLYQRYKEHLEKYKDQEEKLVWEELPGGLYGQTQIKNHNQLAILFNDDHPEFNQEEQSIKFASASSSQIFDNLIHFAASLFTDYTNETGEPADYKLVLRDENGKDLKKRDMYDLSNLHSDIENILADDDQDDSGSDSDDSDAMDGMDPGSILPENTKRKRDIDDIRKLFF